MRFTGKKVYLTGATGFIGGVVARRLLQEGAEVTCLVRPKTSAGDLERQGARIARGDITDPATLDMTGHHVVIHAAAWVGFGLPSRKLPLFRRTNVEGTDNVLAAASRAGISKFVHVSSIAALGTPGDAVATEESARPEEFRSEYERTKTEAHRRVLSSGIPKALPMPGLVLGRNGPFDRLLRALAKGRIPALPGDDAVKGWVHVEDAAEGILLCASRGLGAYLLVDENLRATELFVAALEEAGLPVPRRRVPARVVLGGASLLEAGYRVARRTPPVSRELLQGLVVPMAYDSSRARTELGWRPDLVKRLAEDLALYART